MGRSPQAMKTVRLRPHLGILFALAVGLPSAALVVIAVRSIAGEEAVLEKRLERTLGAELDHVVALVADEMQGAREELGRAAPADSGPRGQAALAAWKASSDLVEVPFLLTADDRLVEPAGSRELSADEQTFLYYNEEFLAGSVQTLVYLNVGVAYLSEILAAMGPAAGGGKVGTTDGEGSSGTGTEAASAAAATEEKDLAAGAATVGTAVGEPTAARSEEEQAVAARSPIAAQDRLSAAARGTGRGCHDPLRGKAGIRGRVGGRAGFGGNGHGTGPGDGPAPARRPRRRPRRRRRPRPTRTRSCRKR